MIVSRRFIAMLAIAVVSFLVSPARAEIPPRDKVELKEEAQLIVAVTVRSIEKKSHVVSGAAREEYRLTVSVDAVEKGAAAKGDTIVVTGWRAVIPEGDTDWSGPGGHYSADNWKYLSDVEEKTQLLLYLGAKKDGAYPILYPNGLEIR